MKTYITMLIALIAMVVTATADDTADLLEQIDRYIECSDALETSVESITDGTNTILQTAGILIMIEGSYEVPEGTHLKTWRDEEDNHLYLKTALIPKARVIRMSLAKVEDE